MMMIIMKMIWMIFTMIIIIDGDDNDDYHNDNDDDYHEDDMDDIYNDYNY